MYESFDGFNLDGEMFFDGWVSVFMANVDYFDCYFIFIDLVGSPKYISTFGEIKMIVESIRVVLHFLP